MSVELTLTGARAGYGAVEVLHGVDLVLPAGRLTAMLGPNGAGKSTLLSVLGGLVPLRGGTLRWGGRDMTTASVRQRVAAGLLLLPERRGTFPGLTVRDNLEVFAAGRDLAPALDAFPVLGERQRQLAGSLSGGEQQMLALTRALLQQPRVLALDEVSFGLAPRVVSQLLEVVRGLADGGTTVLLVEQYVQDALAIADVVYVLARGAVTFAGEPGELADGVPGVTRPTQGV